MQDIAMTYANGWATDFHTEAARILNNQPRPATTAARAAASAPACPFCAGTSITTHLDDSQGTKWGFAACGDCSARGPEVRTGYDRSEHAPWREQALAEWANRAVAMMPTARALAQLYEGLEAVLVSYTLSHWRADADLSLPLVEHSGADGSMDLSAGREEIRQVVDAIYSDVRTPPHQLNSEAWLAVALVRQRIADALHYPAIWDTAAYPSLESAAREAICSVGRGGPTCNRSGHVQD